MPAEPRPRLALVRHAQTAWTGRRYCGRSDPPLSEAGRRAAFRLSVGLAADFGPRPQIISSPRARAVQTAAIIADSIGAPVDIDERWREADFGLAEGRTFDELVVDQPDLAARLLAGDVAIDWPGGEAAAALEARVLAALGDLSGADRPTIVVAHAGPLRIAIAAMTGSPNADVPLPASAEVVWLYGSRATLRP
ncbi:MAG: histidine phosphatase family protein [Candidatus Limnocylindrales bacterium]